MTRSRLSLPGSPVATSLLAIRRRATRGPRTGNPRRRGGACAVLDEGDSPHRADLHGRRARAAIRGARGRPSRQAPRGERNGAMSAARPMSFGRLERRPSDCATPASLARATIVSRACFQLRTRLSQQPPAVSLCAGRASQPLPSAPMSQPAGPSPEIRAERVRWPGHRDTRRGIKGGVPAVCVSGQSRPIPVYVRRGRFWR